MEHPTDNSMTDSNPKIKDSERGNAFKDVEEIMRRMIEAERNNPEHTLESHVEMFEKWKEKYHGPNK